MTDEMRVALVAVAVGTGATVDAAWELVDQLADDPRDARALATEVYWRARADAWGTLAT